MSHASHLLVPPEVVSVILGPEANICHVDDGAGRYYKINPGQGQDIDKWYDKFQAEQRRDGRETTDRFYEILKRDSITKLSFRIPAGPADQQYIVSSCGYVAHKLLSEQSYELSDVSYWYRLDGFLYGVWPMIAMTRFDRQAATDLLDSGYQDPHTRFDRSWLSHYDSEQIQFPLPGGGAQFYGAFNHEGVPKQYHAARHSRRMDHLVEEGGFFGATDSPDVTERQLIKLYRALRLGRLENILTTRERQLVPKDPGYNAVFCTRRMTIREATRLRQQAAAHIDRQVRPFDRLNFIQALDVYGGDAVNVLLECLRRDAAEADAEGGIPEYYHTYNQMNKWFLFEMGKNVLWCKSYDHTMYMSDSERPERYLTIESINPQVVRQCLDGVKVMVENPGKPKPKFQNVYDAWIAHPRGNKVNAVVTNPLPSDAPLINPYHVPNQFNRWRGWDFYSHGHYDRLHAEHHDKTLPQLLMLDTVRTINAFVFGMLCDQDAEAFRIVTLILANVLQRPDSRPEKAVFFKGPEGVGKSLFSKALVTRVFGLTHATEFDRTEHIVGTFNEGSDGKAFIVLEEAVLTDKETIGRFQQMVTGEIQQINGKFKDLRKVKGIATFLGNTNLDNPLFANANARRWVMIAVSPLVQFLNANQKSGLFNRIANLLESDEMYLYAYFLARINLDEWFRCRKTTVMENTALGIAKVQSLEYTSPVVSWLLGCAQSRSFGRKDSDKDAKVVNWDEPVPLLDLYELYKKNCKVHLALKVFTHQLMLALWRVKGFNGKYATDPRLASERGAPNATWVKLPSHADALEELQKKIAGSSQVGDVAEIEKQVAHESQLIKVAKTAEEQHIDLTVEQLLPEYDQTDSTGVSLFTSLFGDPDKICIPCQK